MEHWALSLLMLKQVLFNILSKSPPPSPKMSSDIIKTYQYSHRIAGPPWGRRGV